MGIMDMSQISHRTAIVTGAARGIGSAAAKALAGDGVDVVLAVRDPASAVETTRDVERAGAKALVVACDVADRGSVHAAFEQAVRHFGSIEILVNNAGILDPIASVDGADEEAWARNIQVNLVGAYYCTRTMLPHMVAQGGGTIVNLSSGAAHNPLEGWSAYCAAKAGLAMLTRSIALEYGDKGIRVFGFAPGTTDTDMQGMIRASGVNPISKLKRSDLVPVHEPALGIVYLCSKAADDLAGTEISLNASELRRRIGIRTLG